MGHGSVINVSEQGMLFYFRNTFSDGRENLKHAVIKATLQLQAGTEIKLEGRIIHAENSARVHLGVQFDSPSPGLLDSLFQICTA